MKASVGDRIVMAGEQVDRPTRDGVILEVRGQDGAPPYLVSWADGHTGLLYPGPGSVLRVQNFGEQAPQEPADASGAHSAAPTTAHQWTVRISLFEGDDTTARAVLVADPLEGIRATGVSHRRAQDPPEPRIGDEVAVARALRHLADQLLERATSDIQDSTGEQDVHVSPM
ncbi:MAG: DUF1918 domain-containing protein [Candidatus Nanopelagicales bacterium]|jgi:hypothetical protein|nr:DUF1918 domain-containing protein [Candidatus Nanopelagicales bacterium]